MQHINVVILNPVFLACFVGALVLNGAAVALSLPADVRPVLPWAVAAFVLYAATVVITRRLNIPLNNRLVAAGDPDRLPDPAAVRAEFEDRWVRLNHVRALTSTGALACPGDRAHPVR